jgi:integrase
VTRSLLHRRRAANARAHGSDASDGGWVFPTYDRTGAVTHVVEAKEQRTVLGRKVARLPSPHRLRDTFASAAHESRVHPLDLKVLMNHALPAPDDVTQAYIRPSIEHLRGCVETIAAFSLARMERAGR